MPALKNPRHERFAQGLHKFGIARRAYIEAGYKARRPRHSRESSPVDQSASRLSKQVKVQGRLTELRAMAEKRHSITVDDLIEDLEEDRKLAGACEQAGAAVQATVAKARLLGFMVDRKESGKPGDFSGLATVADVVAAARAELGDAAADALARLLGEPETQAPTHEAPSGRQ